MKTTLLTLIFAFMLTTFSANTGNQTTYQVGKFYTIDGARYKCIGITEGTPRFQGFNSEKPSYHPNKKLARSNAKKINNTKR